MDRALTDAPAPRLVVLDAAAVAGWDSGFVSFVVRILDRCARALPAQATAPPSAPPSWVGWCRTSTPGSGLWRPICGATTDSAWALVEDARRALRELDAGMAPTLTAFHEAAEAARDAMREMRAAGVQVNGLLDGHSPAAYQLADVLDQLGRTARVLRALGEDLERQPDLLLFGRGRSRAE